MGQSGITVVWIVGLAALSWFLFIRPRRRMMTRQRDLLGALSTGDQVVTVGGIYGTVVGLDGDEVRLEIAPDVVIRVARRAVAGRVGLSPAAPAEEPEAAD
ncbi:MAG: preprotein translocase subunit YajC [Gaiellales bacterium]|nr:preprotein translocase subunit YajC [Gaiellales bacterium]